MIADAVLCQIKSFFLNWIERFLQLLNQNWIKNRFDLTALGTWTHAFIIKRLFVDCNDCVLLKNDHRRVLLKQGGRFKKKKKTWLLTPGELGASSRLEGRRISYVTLSVVTGSTTSQSFHCCASLKPPHRHSPEVQLLALQLDPLEKEGGERWGAGLAHAGVGFVAD